MRARVYGALFAPPVSPGPWLATAFAGAFAVLFSPPALGEGEERLFRAIVLHAFPLAVVSTGAVRFAAGRYVGLRLAAGDAEPIVPVLATLTLVAGAGAALLAGLAALALEVAAGTAIALVSLSTVAALLCVASTMATATRDHETVLVAFAAGAAVSAGGAVALSRTGGAAGAAHGFALGQLVAFALIAARALRGPGTGRTFERDVLRSIREEGDLAAAGVLFAAGAFADELIVGWAPLAGALAGDPSPGEARYAEAMFLSSASALPVLVALPIWLVGPVREAYRDLFRALESGATRAEAAARRRALSDALRASLLRLITLAGAIGVAAFLVAPYAVRALDLGEPLVLTARAGVATALLQTVLLLQLSGLAYLESRRMLVLVPAAYAVMTAAFSGAAALLGTATSGIAPAAAALASVALAEIALARALAHFEPDLLTRQPIEP